MTGKDVTLAIMERVEHWRLEHGYTPTEMANMFETSQMQYNRYLTGTRILDMKTLAIICSFNIAIFEEIKETKHEGG